MKQTVIRIPETVEDKLSYMFEQLPPDQKAGLLLQLLREEKNAPTPREIKERQERVQYLLSLYTALNDFADEILSLEGKILKINKDTEKHHAKKHAEFRKKAAGENGLAKAIDGMYSTTLKAAEEMKGVVEVFETFKSDFQQIEDIGVKKAQDVFMQSEGSFMNFEQRLNDFLRAVDMIMRGPTNFIEFVENACDTIADLHNIIKGTFEYSTQDDEKTNEEPPPLFKNHAAFTMFLHNCVRDIPEAQINEGDGEYEFDDTAVWRYAEYLLSFKDKGLLEKITSKNPFESAPSLLESIHSIWSEIMYVYKEVEETRKTDPSRKDRYTNIFEEKSGTKTRSKEEWENFTLDRTTEKVMSLNFAVPSKTPKAKLTNTSKISSRDKMLLEIYGMIEGKLKELLKLNPEDDNSKEEEELTDFVKELMVKKAEFNEKTNKKKTRLKHNKERGNHIFEPAQGGIGILNLNPVEVTNMSYQDIIGASWTEVVNKHVRGVLRSGELGAVFSLGTPRERNNRSVLILGPYGCAKNRFLEAMLNDERIVGIKTTIERLETAYVGESESNVRRLWEMAEEKAKRYEKQTIIAWDEFEQVLEEEEGIVGSVKRGMRKALQTVMQGDKVFDGVHLWALSNEPRKIPPAIYRRFSNVVVIQPLTGEERMELMKYWLSSLPLAEGFEDGVGWNEFVKKTENMSGDMLGKIFDVVFDRFIQEIEEENPDSLTAIDSKIKGISRKGDRVRPEDRKRLFLKTGVVVEPKLFNIALEVTISRQDIISAIENQVDFYKKVDRQMELAFKNDPDQH